MQPGRPRSLCFWLSYALVICLSLDATAAAAAEIAVVVSEEAAAYREVADGIRAGLERAGAGATVRIVTAASYERLPRNDAQAVVAVGTRALRAAAGETRAPVLGTLVPRGTFERILAESGHGGDARRFSAVFLDQPPARQVELIRLALPGAHRIGLLLGAESEPLYATMQAAAAGRHLRIAAQVVRTESQLYPALQKLIGESDVLLALPDRAVFNGTTISNILLTTYRQRLPLVGFSAAYTHAGAVLALYTTPTQIGAQAAEMLNGALAGGLLPPPQYPRDFLVSANPHVARSLGLALEDASVLRDRLSAAEQQ